MLKSLMQMIGFATTLSLLPAFSYAQGTLYKWTDAQGNDHYTNTPTTTTATTVNDTLPPASSFKSPTPPPEAAQAAPPSSESKATPEGEGGAAPGETTGSEPTPAPTDGSATDTQQEADGKPQLTPEQEQALKDSPM